MIKKKKAVDRVLGVTESPLDNDVYWVGDESDSYEFGELDGEVGENILTVSGEMEVGSKGNPVTITITDEVTGLELELSHVRNALLVVEDQRRSSSGWLSMLLGDVYKIGGVIKLISSATLDELTKMASVRKKKTN